MGIEALVPRPGTSKAAPGHKIYPYLLRGVSITEPNHVWASDITYIPMAVGFLYLVAIIDWASRRFWRGACRTRWIPAFASRRSTKRWRGTARRNIQHRSGRAVHQRRLHRQLEAAGIAISMDGRGRFMDNISSSDCGARSNTKKCI